MANTTTNPLPTWLDAWLFGISYVGPLTQFAQLTQAARQSVQLDSINGVFQVNFPSGMQPNDVVEFVDVGNTVVTKNVTLSSVASGLPMQSPATGAIGVTSYAFGSNEKNGSRLIFQYIVDPNLGGYLKNIADNTTGGSGGGAPPPGVGLTGATNPINTGNTINWANTSGGIVYCQIAAGASDGEIKKFKIGNGTKDFVIQSMSGTNIYAGTNDGVAAASVTINGIGNELVLTWLADAGELSSGGWYT